MSEYAYRATILIPVYNAEKYIGKCIESLTEQTVGFENMFEIFGRNVGLQKLRIPAVSRLKPRTHSVIAHKGKQYVFQKLKGLPVLAGGKHAHNVADK